MTPDTLYVDELRGVRYGKPALTPQRQLGSYLHQHRELIQKMGAKFYLSRGTLTEARAKLFGNKQKLHAVKTALRLGMARSYPRNKSRGIHD
jgi:hypothetical protein